MKWFVLLLFLPFFGFSGQVQNYDAFAALDMEKQEGFEVTSFEYNRLQSIYRYMDSVIEFSKETDAQKALHICLTMSAVLETGFGISYENTTLLSEGLRKNKLDCNYYSLIFYTYLKQHTQNATLVITPGHMFLRWYYNGNLYLNYETTSKEVLTDEEYTGRFGISATAIENNLYLNPLSDLQSMACGYLEMSNATGSVLKQKMLLNKALNLFPNLVMAISSMAYCAVLENKTNEAIRLLQKAIALDTLNYATYQQAGRIYQKAKRYNEAIQYYSKGIDRNPNDPQACIYRSNCYLDMGKVDAAMADFDKSLALLKTEDVFKFLLDYISLQLLEERIMEEYLKMNGE